MTGVITLRHVLAHPYLIVHEYGGRLFLRCLLCALKRERCTFLSLVWR